MKIEKQREFEEQKIEKQNQIKNENKITIKIKLKK